MINPPKIPERKITSHHYKLFALGLIFYLTVIAAIAFAVIQVVHEVKQEANCAQNNGGAA